jgi:hypothetical protein
MALLVPAFRPDQGGCEKTDSFFPAFDGQAGALFSPAEDQDLSRDCGQFRLQRSWANARDEAERRREEEMKLEGGCYCGRVRYVAEGEPIMKAQCHCRECQYISGGSPNMFMIMPSDGFSYIKGTPKQFTRSDLDRPATREFCPECGTHLLTRRPGLPAVILKVGTLDDPSLFGGPKVAIHTLDKQTFHHIPDGMPAFDRLPPR